MRGVISLCFALSPVESYRLFPWLTELTATIYAHVMLNARGITAQFFAMRKNEIVTSRTNCYFTNSDSRNWSRPTNDFTVLNLPNKSWISRFW